MKTVNWSREEFNFYYTEDWKQSVDIVYWEHDIESDSYVIRFKIK